MSGSQARQAKRRIKLHSTPLHYATMHCTASPIAELFARAADIDSADGQFGASQPLGDWSIFTRNADFGD
ncbi:MAG: hypothetical protein WBR26_24390 [Candidatus Acidiferrum sp.]